MFGKPGIPQDIFESKRGEFSVYDTEIYEGSRFEKIIDEIRDEKGNPILDEHGKTMSKVGWNEDKGFLTWHKTFLYPEKGWRNSQSVWANQHAKRILICWLRFFSFKKLWPAYLILFPWRIKIIEKWLDEFQQSVTLFLQQFYLEKKYYSPISKEIWAGCETFLNELGVSKEKSELFAKNLATFIQYDTAYYYPLGDIMCETSAKQMLKGGKEIKRLIRVLYERSDNPNLNEKFAIFAKFLTAILWIPKVRKAFRKAVHAMNFQKLQLDEEDKYNLRLSRWNGKGERKGYKWFGMTQEERDAKWPPEQHLYFDHNTGGLIITDGRKFTNGI
ncbi:MAG: hypothetical protein AAB875_04115 [Patescibacteria group bacterium]